MPLPHISNAKAGFNLYDPMHESIFEIIFTMPWVLTANRYAEKYGQAPLGEDDYARLSMTQYANGNTNALPAGEGDDYSMILTSQVTDVTGLDALQKTVTAGEQKFLGTSVSFLNPVHDNTYIEFQVNLNLNLRSTTDAYVLRTFKAWSRVGYDLMSGVRTRKSEYVAPFMKILEANRNGVVWRSVSLKDVMLVGLSGLDTLNYTSMEARKLQCTFRSDYWTEEIGDGEYVSGVNSVNGRNAIVTPKTGGADVG